MQAWEDLQTQHLKEAVYVGAEGPRYETPAEIALYQSWGGDVVGMTNIPEAVLAREAGLCYAAVAVVTNAAAGIGSSPVSHDEVRIAAFDARSAVVQVLRHAVSDMPSVRACTCGNNTMLRL